MADWLPVAKAILPFLGEIIAVAKPVFTKRKGGSEASQIAILQQQVAELQTASLQNIEDIKALAEQLKTAVPSLEQEVMAAQATMRRANWLAGISLVLTLLALAVAMTALLR